MPVRAIIEALGEQVNWDQDTKTVYIGERPKSALYGAISPEDFLKKHVPYRGSKFGVQDAGTVQIRQEDYNYFNRIWIGYYDSGTYLINGNYTKIKGLFLADDGNKENSSVRSFQVEGDGKMLFKARDLLEKMGHEYGIIVRGDKNQPIPFEVDITGVEELRLSGSGGWIYNVEFIGFEN